MLFSGFLGFCFFLKQSIEPRFLLIITPFRVFFFTAECYISIYYFNILLCISLCLNSGRLSELHRLQIVLPPLPDTVT